MLLALLLRFPLLRAHEYKPYAIYATSRRFRSLARLQCLYKSLRKPTSIHKSLRNARVLAPQPIIFPAHITAVAPAVANKPALRRVFFHYLTRCFVATTRFRTPADSRSAACKLTATFQSSLHKAARCSWYREYSGLPAAAVDTAAIVEHVCC